MPYFVETAPAVLDYIAAVEGLSDEGREAVVDGTHMGAGVVRVVYVEHTTQPIP